MCTLYQMLTGQPPWMAFRHGSILYQVRFFVLKFFCFVLFFHLQSGWSSGHQSAAHLNDPESSPRFAHGLRFVGFNLSLRFFFSPITSVFLL